MENNIKIMDPNWDYFNGIEYINIDFRGITDDDEKINIVGKSVEMGLKKPDNSIRALLIVKGSKTTPSAMRVMKKEGKKVQSKMKKSAVVGSVGILSLLLRIYVAYTGSTMRFFTDEEAALKYITSD